MTKVQCNTATKLARVAWLSGERPDRTFGRLVHHINEESLLECFKELDKNAALGVDDISKEEYSQNLVENIKDLMKRMLSMSYRPQPVKQVFIPKENGKLRPLGISTIEDKLIQKAVQKILESVYEPLFLECSFGFRPGIGCHTAIKALRDYLYYNEVAKVLDVDIENFFGSIDHKELEAILREKIEDNVLMRYIIRMLKAGVLTNGEFNMTDEGVLQGSICSPVLANIFAHYVIDVWFQNVVKKHCSGKVELFRYADDCVICCEYGHDAMRIKQALANRLAKYKLKMNDEKTKMVAFSKKKYAQGIKQESFDFLGFTFYLGRSKKGHSIPKMKTRKERFKGKLKALKNWINRIKNQYTLKPIWQSFKVKIQGHIAYFGVSFNYRVGNFVYEALKIMYKGLNSCSQRRSKTWEEFMLFVDKFPLPKVKVYLKLF